MDSSRQHVVIGTAGHIDHGKSAIVKAITGTDPDRLIEEKERGMTIDLGFAFWGDNVTFIDVPGHEKFIKNMLAGATTIDLVLLVVAADDGIMPQTIEHFEITKILNIKQGLIVINKIDLVEKSWLELVIEDVKNLVKDSFLADAPIIPVSTVTGEGIEVLKRELTRLLNEVKPKVDRGVFRLPIDRIFTMKGFGTVVAGTVLSGKVHVGDQVEILPQRKIVKVRNIQVHNRTVERAQLGERAAFNLLGIEKSLINRGDVLAQPGYYRPTLLINAAFTLLKDFQQPLKHMSRVRVHIGTSEIMGRVYLIDRKELCPGESGLVQLRLENETVCDRTDRFVVRTYSPQRTIGGGVVLEPNPEKAVRYDRVLIEKLNTLMSESPEDIVNEIIRHSLNRPLEPVEIAQRSSFDPEKIFEILKRLVEKKKIVALLGEKHQAYYNTENYQNYKRFALDAIQDMFNKNPLRIDIKHSELKALFPKDMNLELFNIILKDLAKERKIKFEDGVTITIPDLQISLKKDEQMICDRIERLLLENRFNPPSVNEIVQNIGGDKQKVSDLINFLINSRVLIKVGEGMVFHKDAIQEAEAVIRQHFAQKTELRASDFKERIGTSRKYAIPLLTYFDQKGLTLRRGEVRVFRDKQF